VKITTTAGNVKIAATTGTEGFMYLITTDANVPSSHSASYLDTTIDGNSEDSSKLALNFPVSPWTTLTQRQGSLENDENGTNLTSHTAKIGERLKVKLQVDTNAGAAAAKALKLQYDKNDNTWVDVKASGEIRPALSTAFQDGEQLGSADAGACQGGTTATAGVMYEGRSVTDALALSGSTCKEIGFAIDTRSAAANTTYRFRLYNVTDGAALTYSATAPIRRSRPSRAPMIPSGSARPACRTCPRRRPT
jgi:hypothetical protein